MKIIGKIDAKEQGLQFYFTGKACVNNHLSKRYVSNGHCHTCHKNDVDARYELKKEEYLKVSNEHYHKNKEKYKKTRHQYYLDNTESILERNNRWKRNNKPKRASDAAKRRAIKKQAIPIWADLKAIEAMYLSCPKGYHVDHIIPLVSKVICGLHVENNLQHLSASENMSKHNNFKAYIEHKDCHDEHQRLETLF